MEQSKAGTQLQILNDDNTTVPILLGHLQDILLLRVSHMSYILNVCIEEKHSHAYAYVQR